MENIQNVFMRLFQCKSSYESYTDESVDSTSQVLESVMMSERCVS